MPYDFEEYETAKTCPKDQLPDWAQGRYLNEVGFCRDFLAFYPMVYSEDQFFSQDGQLSMSAVRKMVFDYLSNFVSTSLGSKVNALMETLKLRCQVPELPFSETKIHCGNGYFDLMQDRFEPFMDYCRFRLPVCYNAEAPEPVLWLRFLRDLLEEADIVTLQEYIGYCLLPVNYGQKMLLIIGNGGEGKSRIGVVLQKLLGSNLVNGSIAKLEASPFARADLQNRLLMVDDDLQLEGLKSTNHIKSIISAETPMDLERKGIQSYQAKLYCRLMAFGNGSLQALHDRSYGFFRRQIILTAKPRPRDRVDDPYLAVAICNEELEGIFLWAIEGLLRLVNNNMKFTLSKASRKNLLSAMGEGNNILDFMKSQGYIRQDAQGSITSRSMYNAYRDWCEDNMLTPLAAKTFISWLIQHAWEYNILYDTNIVDTNGRRVRGFRGMTRARDF